MARKHSSVLEDLMDISAQLPWQVGVGLAVVAYFAFHYFATQTPMTTNPAELKAIGKTLGDTMAHSMWTAIAGVLQYVVPLAFLIGAGVSAVRGRRHGNAATSQGEDAPVCPKCGSAMVRRTAKQGSNAGHSFWGCSQYPACRGIRNA